jgi:hypothetical protein
MMLPTFHRRPFAPLRFAKMLKDSPNVCIVSPPPPSCSRLEPEDEEIDVCKLSKFKDNDNGPLLPAIGFSCPAISPHATSVPTLLLMLLLLAGETP